VEISVEELAAAMIKAGWYFPSQHAAATIAAQDIFLIIIRARGDADREAGGG
jgi:hypothetical protein